MFRVTETGFQDCMVHHKVRRPCVSESDTIVLETPGRKWYICGVGKHCENGGQKLVITVQPAPSIAPSLLQSMPYYSSKGAKTTTYQTLRRDIGCDYRSSHGLSLTLLVTD